MLRFTPSACTDVTGFGLAGHLLEMAKGSRKQIQLDTGSIPFIPQAIEYASMGLIPAGTYATRKFCTKHFQIDSSVRQVYSDLIFDPQTSGGLLFSLPRKQAEECVNIMKDKGITAAIIGKITGDHPEGLITVT
jgi:selenide,water dikinase